MIYKYNIIDIYIYKYYYIHIIWYNIYIYIYSAQLYIYIYSTQAYIYRHTCWLMNPGIAWSCCFCCFIFCPPNMVSKPCVMAQDGDDFPAGQDQLFREASGWVPEGRRDDRRRPGHVRTAAALGCFFFGYEIRHFFLQSGRIMFNDHVE